MSRNRRSGCPHTHSRDERYAQQRFAPAVDMTGRGQLLRTCPHPLDNPFHGPEKPDISNELTMRTFLKSFDSPGQAR
jgi:hypothetical protein